MARNTGNYNIGLKESRTILSLGVCAEVTLKQTREKRYEAKKKLEEGKNSGGNNFQGFDENTAYLEKEKPNTTTFQKVFHEWFSRQSINWTERHSRGVESSGKLLGVHIGVYRPYYCLQSGSTQ